MNKVCQLLKIEYPIIQAGMNWCSPWQLASEVSNAGGLGVIGAASMYPEILEEHIIKLKNSCSMPFGVNVPLQYPDLEKLFDVIIDNKVPIVITSAGNPSIWTQKFKDGGSKIIHVVSSLKFALKAQRAGVDAIVAEGYEAGGHNGIEENTTFCLLQSIQNKVGIPIIAAGGIANGRGMLAAMMLGADGVQIGSRFVLSQESSAHENFKNELLTAGEGGTKVMLKELTPVRLFKNKFYKQIKKLESIEHSISDLKKLLGKGRAKSGMFNGDLDEGELEIGQIISEVNSIKPAKEIVHEIVSEYNQLMTEMDSDKFNFNSY